MSTSFSFLPLYRIRRNLQTGLGEARRILSWTVADSREYRRTKKKDIYVISTLQRPVPLEHYLYAGRDKFKIVDAKRSFLAHGCVMPFTSTHPSLSEHDL